MLSNHLGGQRESPTLLNERSAKTKAMTTLKGLVAATAVALAIIGIVLARDTVPNAETASLLLLGVGMIGIGVLVGAQAEDGNDSKATSTQELALNPQGQIEASIGNHGLSTSSKTV